VRTRLVRLAYRLAFAIDPNREIARTLLVRGYQTLQAEAVQRQAQANLAAHREHAARVAPSN
jgi:hypothetical protein